MYTIFLLNNYFCIGCSIILGLLARSWLSVSHNHTIFDHEIQFELWDASENSIFDNVFLLMWLLQYLLSKFLLFPPLSIPVCPNAKIPSCSKVCLHSVRPQFGLINLQIASFQFCLCRPYQFHTDSSTVISIKLDLFLEGMAWVSIGLVTNTQQSRHSTVHKDHLLSIIILLLWTKLYCHMFCFIV